MLLCAKSKGTFVSEMLYKVVRLTWMTQKDIYLLIPTKNLFEDDVYKKMSLSEQMHLTTMRSRTYTCLAKHR